MKDFIENHCRVCKKVFCCKECRQKHEAEAHNIYPECDICLTGTIVLKNFSPNLLEHIKANHWPLRCVYCHRFFGTEYDLQAHEICTVGFQLETVEKAPFTPRSFLEPVYDSPPFILLTQKPALMSTLTTSTPMHRGEENMLGNMQETITPVEFTQAKKSSLKKSSSVTNSSMKRKVTFSDTPTSEFSKKQETNPSEGGMKADLSNSPSGASVFYTVNELSTPVLSVTSAQSMEKKEVKNLEETSLSNNKTDDVSSMWTTALNVSPEKTNPSLYQNQPNLKCSPVILKKRKINVVSPLSKQNNQSISTPITSYPSLSQIDSLESVHTPTSVVNRSIVETPANNGKVWLSMSQIVCNVLHGIGKNTSRNTSLKRCLSETSFTVGLDDEPQYKRFKILDIKCRRTIHDLPPIKFSRVIKAGKTFVDKATQTDF